MRKKLVFEFVRYEEISKLGSDERISKVLSLVKENKIILLEGRFKKDEEAMLIQKTMESINTKFKGIEIAVINPEAKDNIFGKIRSQLANLLFGERDGITLIGPASIIREIKQNPHKLNQLSIDLS